jgi:hypothetical protein
MLEQWGVRFSPDPGVALIICVGRLSVSSLLHTRLVETAHSTQWRSSLRVKLARIRHTVGLSVNIAFIPAINFAQDPMRKRSES